MMKRGLLGVYEGAWKVATPLLRKHKRLREGFAERLVPFCWPLPVVCDGQPLQKKFLPQGPVVWLQAASGGEAWLVHSLVEALQQELALHPDVQLTLLCTTCTVQGLEVLRKLPSASVNGALQIHTAYFPLDAPSIMRRAVAQATPALMVLLETELWPGLLAVCREAAVPVMVLNGRMTEKSFAGYRWLGSFWRNAGPGRVLAISEADAARFAALVGTDRVAVMSNIKFDRVAVGPSKSAAGASAAVAASPVFSVERRGSAPTALAPCVAFSSVREEEEDQLFGLIERFCQHRVHGHAVALVVAPRHMHRVSAWEDFLISRGITFVRRSANQHVCVVEKENPPVLLWDTFGELDCLYAMADVVFVGGSLAPLGGQNFLEPLMVGKHVVTGPFVDNFLWVGDALFQQGLIQKVVDAVELEMVLMAHCAAFFSPDGSFETEARVVAAHERSARFADWLAPHTGGSVQAVRALLGALSV